MPVADTFLHLEIALKKRISYSSAERISTTKVNLAILFQSLTPLPMFVRFVKWKNDVCFAYELEEKARHFDMGK